MWQYMHQGHVTHVEGGKFTCVCGVHIPCVWVVVCGVRVTFILGAYNISGHGWCGWHQGLNPNPKP